MSRATPPSPVPRPALLDYFLLFVGFGLSLYLMELHPLTVEAGDSISETNLRAAIGFLPRLLRLTEGVVLLFPFFFVTQFTLGRRAGLTAAEWLWALAWCGTALLTALDVCDHFQLLPQFVQTNLLLIRFIWYIGFVLSMAAIALILVCVGFFGAVRPWTHQLGLALALWPVAPLAGILTLTKQFV